MQPTLDYQRPTTRTIRTRPWWIVVGATLASLVIAVTGYFAAMYWLDLISAGRFDMLPIAIAVTLLVGGAFVTELWAIVRLDAAACRTCGYFSGIMAGLLGAGLAFLMLDLVMYAAGFGVTPRAAATVMRLFGSPLVVLISLLAGATIIAVTHIRFARQIDVDKRAAAFRERAAAKEADARAARTAE